jgi:hypothetical protein
MNVHFTIVLGALAVMGVGPSFAQLPDDLKRKFDQADQKILRLPPSAFPQIPGNIVRELKRRGCTIPQSTRKPQNVVVGDFTRLGQQDWAILCSVNRVSSILVFFNGSEKNVHEVARAADRNYLVRDMANQIGYSRGIYTVGKDFIKGHDTASLRPEPPKFDHQGIQDSLLGKAPVIVTHYFYQGNWLKLTGAD